MLNRRLRIDVSCGGKARFDWHYYKLTSSTNVNPAGASKTGGEVWSFCHGVYRPRPSLSYCLSYRHARTRPRNWLLWLWFPKASTLSAALLSVCDQFCHKAGHDRMQSQAWQRDRQKQVRFRRRSSSDSDIRFADTPMSLMLGLSSTSSSVSAERNASSSANLFASNLLKLPMPSYRFPPVFSASTHLLD